MPTDDIGDPDFDDPTSARPVPDPLDRVWRHPSEMATAHVPNRRERRRAARPAATNRFPVVFAVVCAAVGSSILTIAVLTVAGAFDDATPSAPVQDAALAKRTDTDWNDAAAMVRPAIVSVIARDHGVVRRGAGVAIRQGAELLTAAALVRDLRTVEIVTARGSHVTANVVGRDDSSGLALLAVHAELPAAKLATRAPTPGDSVASIGARGWTSIGIVNSVQLVLANHGGVTMRGLTAASVAEGPDATGAALIDDHGAVVAIQLGAQHAAVPIAYAREAADQLRRVGWVRHGWIGISGHDQSDGVAIAAISTESPAARAGLRVGDHIVAIDDDSIDTMSDVMAAVRTAWPGDSLRFSVQRDGATVRIDVQVGASTAAGTTNPATSEPVAADTTHTASLRLAATFSRS